jgi:hypothetical protein
MADRPMTEILARMRHREAAKDSAAWKYGLLRFARAFQAIFGAWKTLTCLSTLVLADCASITEHSQSNHMTGLDYCQRGLVIGQAESYVFT